MRSRFIKSCIETIHISWHISAVCVGVLVGVSLLRALPYELFSGWPWLIGGVSLFLAASIKRARALLAVSLLAGCCVGMWRGGIDQRALLGYAPHYGRIVQLSGQVREDASIGKHGEWQLQLSGIQLDGHGFSGKVWASVSAGVSIKRGDTVYLKGVLDQGFGNMAASMYRTQLARVERPYPGDVARRIRDWFAGGVRQGIAEPQASLGIGFLTGQHSALPAALDEQLRVAGLTHIVVASGYNLTVLVGFARRVFAGVSKYLSTLSSVFMIGGFMMVAGLGASMSRAGLVAGLS
jgi:competence protein ComEC